MDKVLQFSYRLVYRVVFDTLFASILMRFVFSTVLSAADGVVDLISCGCLWKGNTLMPNVLLLWVLQDVDCSKNALAARSWGI